MVPGARLIPEAAGLAVLLDTRGARVEAVDFAPATLPLGCFVSCDWDELGSFALVARLRLIAVLWVAPFGRGLSVLDESVRLILVNVAGFVDTVEDEVSLKSICEIFFVRFFTLMIGECSEKRTSTRCCFLADTY